MNDAPVLLSMPEMQRRVRWLRGLCLLLWVLVTLAPLAVARRADWVLWGWPLDYWLAAQGSLLCYLALVAVYAVLVNRWQRQTGQPPAD